ncbi:MAG: DUF2726 domain-containing protein [Nitrospina sp.]|jgi:hypothetical protein|nr:DUF2726 domain-containing protein [Nitrospina sp.]MBT3415034.1 DUF2726 domain-containing protein [Nitrospina sp.]MBT3856635.1 DUF2726 domain-containing protein [Nitrospina sp.]MBT4103552.1 DUF2726 domain-containing protein [Nitrospina sp.]MBT4388741.1 DUF2726 domain-containing protein [Nitrospina sp.]
MDFSLEKTLLKPIAALAIVLIFIWFVTKFLGWVERKFNKSSYFPYSKKEQFFSDAERKFYDALIEAVGPEFMVFSKCGAVDLLDVDFQKHFAAFKRINSMQVDFVVVRKGDGSLACAIELGGELHERFDKESLFLDEAFSTAGLPLIRFETQEVYSVSEIQKALVLSI